MKLYVFVLNRTELLERVLEAYVEAGVAGATILDSEGMGRYLAYEVPLFADFKALMKGSGPENKTILSVVRDEAVGARLRKLVGGAVGGFAESGAGIMFSVPVDWVSSLAREGED